MTVAVNGIRPENVLWYKLLFTVIVAGKSARFAENCLRTLLQPVANDCNLSVYSYLQQLAASHQLETALRQSRTGNYRKLTTAICQLLVSNLDLATTSPQALESIHGIGPKTSRFFVLWTQPEALYAVLDTHVLKWLAALGYNVPKTTPQSRKQYAALEQVFLSLARDQGKTPRELDYEIWQQYSGYKS